MSSRLERLAGDTLLGLLQMYDTALAELKTTGDQHVAGLMLHLKRHRAEVIAALAAQSVDVARPRETGGAHSQLISQASRGRRAANS
jgi:anti-sigma-K factor RskA